MSMSGLNILAFATRAPSVVRARIGRPSFAVATLAAGMLLVACRLGPDVRRVTPVPPRIPVHVVSDDPVLREVVCERLHCRLPGPGERGTPPTTAPAAKAPTAEAAPRLRVDIALHDSTADLLRNNLTSLATLTTTAFVTHTVDVDYSLEFTSPSESFDRIGTVRVRHGMWAVLPVYMGLAATNIGSILNTHADPVELQYRCLAETDRPGAWIHGNRTRTCAEYRDFLHTLILQLEPQLHATLLPSSSRTGTIVDTRRAAR